MSMLLRRSICVFLLAGFGPLALAAANYAQGGYADRTSVAQGGTIAFHIATSIAPFSVEIVNLAQPAQVLTTLTGLTSAPSDCTGMWENGCAWPVTTQFTIPSSWPSGYYAARFPTSGGTRNIIFVVRAANPGLASRIVVVSPTNTYEAYNQFGGKSVYDSISTNGKRAHIVSFQRPYYDNLGLGRYPAWEQFFVDWLTAEQQPFEVITDDDLADPSIISQYQLVVLAGHSEYWSLEARQSLQTFLEGGGNVAVFSGNTMWWQVRVDLATRQMTVYKSAALDPLRNVDNSRVTVNWYDNPVYNPENFILGTSFRNAGYTNVYPGTTNALPVAERTPFTVVNASSWLFDGTGLLNGGTFGKASAGNEVDGSVFNTLPTGELIVDGSDGTPLNFEIVATIPAEEGYGTIGLYTNAAGGTVVNVGSRDWLRGLATDEAVQQITRNVLRRLSLEEPLPYVERTTSWRMEDLFNTPVPMEGVLPGWSGDLLEASLAPQCATEGPFGLQMKGAEWTQLIRSFSPDHAGLGTAWVSFDLNADQLTGLPNFSMPIVELLDERGSFNIYAAVEMQLRSSGKSIRLSLYRADGSRSGTTSWAVLPPGWQRVTVAWRSPGVSVLRVGSGIELEVNNLDAGQVVTELMMEFAGTEFGATGSLCLDQIRLRESIVDTTPMSAPAMLDAVTTTPSKVTITWAAVANAAEYRVERSADNTTFTVIATVPAPGLSVDDTSVALNTSYLYRVIAVGEDGNTGPPSPRDVATTKKFVSDPKRVIRAAHINDLRTSVNALRTMAGLPAATYTRVVAVGVAVRAADLLEMRSAVNVARAAAGLPAYSFEAIGVNAPIQWSHWRELQMAIGAIAAGV
jgi:hypothetical protein